MNELKREILRKLIHFSGLLYIPGYQFLGYDYILLSIIVLIFIFLPFEILRIKKGYFSLIAREYEMKRVGAHIYFLISILLVTFFFMKDACFVAIITSVLGDGIAGITRKISKNDFTPSFSMFFSSAFACYFFNLLNPYSLSAIFFGTAVERVQKIRRIYIQDNFSVPLATAFSHHSVKYISSYFCSWYG